MNTIDERVVEMRFDNKDFESNAQQSIGTIEKLKRSLNFGESSKSLEGLSSSIKNLPIGSVAGSVTDLGSRFSAMGALATGAIATVGAALTHHILNTLNQIKSALHLDAIDNVKNMMLGWDKYATKTQSVATIMAATGESIETVSAAMDRLNFFTDETSYDFADMTNNIGKFTANGIGLDDASSAMQGIATWAARSGQNAGTASRVMYNLAQAIGMGALKLQDWKSVELANMGTQEFKETAIQTGIAIGALTEGSDGLIRTAKGTEVSIQNFRETLAEGWLDNDVLMATLQEYGKAADLINGINEATGLLSSHMMDLVELERAGALTIQDVQKALEDSGDPMRDSAEHVQEVYEAIQLLASEEYEFSLATYKAAQEARTFGDAMNSVADAVGTAWMNTFELIFGNYEHAKVLWTDLANNLYEIFAEPINARNELLRGANRNGKEDLLNYMDELGIATSEFDKALANVLPKLEVDSLLVDYESLTDAFKDGRISVASTVAAVRNLASGVIHLNKQTETSSMSFQELDDLAVRVLRMEFGYLGSERMAALKAIGYTEEQAQAILDYVVARHEMHAALSEEDAQQYLDVFKEINEVTGEAIELTDEQREELKRLAEQADKQAMWQSLQEGFMNIGAIAVDTFTNIRTAIRTAIPPMTSAQLRDIAKGFANITGRVHELVTGNGFSNLLSLLMIPLQALHSVATGLLSLLGPLANLAWALVSPLLQVVSAFGEWIKLIQEATGITNPFAGIVGKVVEALRVLIEFATKVAQKFGEIVKGKLIEKLSGPFFNLATALQKFREDKMKSLDEFIEKIQKADVNEAVSTIINKIKGLRQFATGLLESAKNSELFATALQKIQSVSIPVGDALKKIQGVFTAIKTIFQYFRNEQGESFFSALFHTIQEVASTALKRITLKLNDLGISTDSIKDKFKSVKDTLSSFKDSFVQKFGEAKTSLGEFISSLGITLPKVLKGVALTGAGVGIIGFIAKLKDAKDSGGGSVLENIAESLNPFADVLEKLKTATSSFNILNFAIAIGILAAALIALSFVPAEGLAKALGVLGGALAEFLGVLAVSSKMISGSGAAKLIGIGLGMIAIAGALMLFAKVIERYSQIKIDNIKQVVKILGFLFLAVESLRKLAKVAGKNNFKLSNGLGLIAAAGALLVFGKVLESYANLKIGRNNVDKVLGALAAAVVSLGVISFAAGKARFKMSNGLGLIGLATAMLILARVMANLGKIPKEELIRGGIALSALGVLLSLMMAAINLTAKGVRLGNGLGQLAIMTGMVGALVTLAITMALLGYVPNGALLKGYIVLATLGGLLVLMNMALNTINKIVGIKKALTQLALLSGIVIALAAFAVLLTAFAALAAPMGLGLVGLLAVLLGLLAAFGAIKAVSMMSMNFKNVIAIIGEVALLGLALIPLAIVLERLSKLDDQAASKGLMMIAEILGVFFALTFVAGALTSVTGGLFAVGLGVMAAGMLVFVGTIALLVHELEKLSALDPAKAEAGIQAIKNLINALTDLATDIQKDPGLFLSGIGATVLGLGFGAALHSLATDAQILGLVNAQAAIAGLEAVQAEIDFMFNLGEYLATTEGAFSKGMDASIMAWLFGVGLAPLANDTRILGMTNAAAAAAAMEPMQNLIAMMFSTASTLGSDPGLFVQAAAVSAEMMMFGFGLLPLVGDTFLLGMSNAANASANFTTITSVITQLFDIATLMGSDTSLYENAEKVGWAVQDFGIALRGLVVDDFLMSFVDVEDASAGFDHVKSIIQFLIDTARLFEVDEGLFDAAKDVATAAGMFATALLGLGIDSLIDMFVDSESASSGFESSKEKIQFLIDTARIFEVDEGLFDSAQKAAEASKLFAGSLTALTATEFWGQFVDTESAASNIANLQSMVTMLVDMATDFQGEGMFESAEQASNACVKFAKSLKKLTRSENKIAKADSEAALEGLQPIQTMVTMLIEAAKEFAGNEGMAEGASDAATAMETFATKLKTVATKLNGIGGKDFDDEMVKSLITAITGSFTDLAAVGGQLGTVGTTIAAISTLLDTIGSLGSKSLTGKFSIDSSGIAEAISTIITSVGDISKLTEAQTAFQTFSSETTETFGTLTTKLNTVGTEAGDNFVKGISSKGVSAGNAAKTMATLAKNGANSQTSAFSTVGATMGSNLANALLAQSGAASAAGSAVARAAYAGMLGYYTQVYHVGENIGAGLVDGLRSKEGQVSAAAQSLAYAVIRALSLTMVVRSPSRVTREIGGYVAEGLALGMEDSMPMVTETAEYMANNMLSVTQRIAEQINDVIEDPNYQPTVTPVLDLTTLKSQAGAIDTIVTANRSLALSGRIAGQMDCNQNAGNQSIVALDPVTIAEIAANQPDININFEGSLAGLARVLQPAIVTETNRLGPNLVNE